MESTKREKEVDDEEGNSERFSPPDHAVLFALAVSECCITSLTTWHQDDTLAKTKTDSRVKEKKEEIDETDGETLFTPRVYRRPESIDTRATHAHHSMQKACRPVSWAAPIVLLLLLPSNLDVAVF